MMAHTEPQIQQTIDQLQYDFSQFTLRHFIGHLMHLRQRAVLVYGYPFDPGLFAVWIRAETADYVFYNQFSHPIHQVHNILHELGHILLNHHCRRLADYLPPEVLAQLNLIVTGLHGQFRMVRLLHQPDELEAERFVQSLRRQIVTAQRLDQLTHHASSIEGLDQFARHLGFHV